MSLKSLEEHNAEWHAIHSRYNEPRPNGIACPKCGEELMDSRPNMSYCSFPPQKAVSCKCGYTGMRVA